jgi:hypothetical protein
VPCEQSIECHGVRKLKSCRDYCLEPQTSGACCDELGRQADESQLLQRERGASPSCGQIGCLNTGKLNMPLWLLSIIVRYINNSNGAERSKVAKLFLNPQ